MIDLLGKIRSMGLFCFWMIIDGVLEKQEIGIYQIIGLLGDTFWASLGT